jgi:hypothetical protein
VIGLFHCFITQNKKNHRPLPLLHHPKQKKPQASSIASSPKTKKPILDTLTHTENRNCPRSPLSGTDLSEKIKEKKISVQKISSITLSMLLYSLSVAQRRKSNKRTKKNKEEQNDLKGKQ